MFAARQAICWVVTEGVVGMENQCLGLASKLNMEPVVKRIRLHTPWKQTVPFFRHGLEYAYSRKGDEIAPPWPDLIIASGRAAVPACLMARRAPAALGCRKTFTVYIQNPVIDPSRFDLVALPRHDGVLGENVITTRGSLHRVTPELLKAEAEKLAPNLPPLPSPLIAVLIGGSNSVYQLTPREMAPIAFHLAELAKSTGGSLMITTSRRTGEANVQLLRTALEGVPHFLWTGEGPNPYYGMLGLADAILVTCDSVNMTSEACSTGKPVHVIPLPGGSEKFRLFHQTLRDDGMTRPFAGRLEKWSYQPLDDVQLVANRVREMMGALP